MARSRAWATLASVAAWVTLACVMAVVFTAVVGVRTSVTELSSQAPTHGVSAKASRGGLDSYFRKQSLAIKQQAAKDEAQKKRHMSAAAANADLNKYFDSLQSHTKKGKLTTLAKEVTDLSKDVKAILQPMKQLQDSATASKNAVSSLKEDTKMLLKDDTSRRGVAERAEKAAERAAESAKTAANRRAQDETIVIRQALKRVPKTKYLKAKQVNPKMTVEGLPPNWAAYMDMKTKYAYFYNKHSGKSSWINPKGGALSVKGLPAGWEALEEKGGKDYYVNIKSGRSTWEDPRVIPGGKVLALINRGSRHRAVMHRQAEKMAKLAALSDDNGVYSHNYARSQWADKDWMKFLDTDHASAKAQSLMTTNQQLRRGEVGSEQAMPHQVASDSY